MAAIRPLITFKAGICDVDQSSKPYKVKPQPKPGYISLYRDPPEDDLIHFSWRERNKPLEDAELELLMPPEDGHFVPYEGRPVVEPGERPIPKPSGGRVFVLKFSSSSQRHLFWLQSKPQGSRGASDPSHFSPRDLRIGGIVDRLLQGEEVDVTRELADAARGGGANDDDDETMEDIEGRGDPSGHHRGSTGGAGPDATGGDVREEGEDAREGGADGARAAAGESQMATDAVRNLLESLRGAQFSGRQGAVQGKLYPQLGDLLRTSVTVPVVQSLGDEEVDKLISLLPPRLVLIRAAINDLVPFDMAEASSDDADAAANDAETVGAVLESMKPEAKRELVVQVLRSPMFMQSLKSLTTALSEGGLPSIAEALGIDVENGGLVRGGNVPLGSGEAVEAFVNGVKKAVQKKT